MKPFSSVGLASHLMTRMCLFVQYADKTQHVGSMPSTGQHGGILERLEELSKRLFITQYLVNVLMHIFQDLCTPLQYNLLSAGG